MVKMVMFATEKDLRELTGLDHNDLWDAGFNLDDWDIGLQCDEKLHREPTEEEIWEEGYAPDDIIISWDSPYCWLLSTMNSYYAGPSYTEYKGKHYYLVHHA